MSSAAARALKSVSRAAFSWKPVSKVLEVLVFENLYLKPYRLTPFCQTGRPQQTVAVAMSRSGVGLHSGACVTATLIPTARIALHDASTGRRRGPRVRTVEHLLSAMEALGVDNCGVEVGGGGDETPLLDGSAQEWVVGNTKHRFVCSRGYQWANLEETGPPNL
ncbi:hypothetical protein C2845_PM01G09190 [Panicum miliaceum]|uniref:Uncharacterized protein n=1 Tax=Panicum miliaceum TaxID=4540 RepID=A0A3L6THE9_PANMI|nr:hypothetical protein C2845_PM01G09190 [Panicum miliaceum]